MFFQVRIKAQKQARGLTLLEVMIAICLLAVTAYFLAMTNSASMSATWKAREYQAAARAAREKLEEIQLIGFPDLTTTLAARRETTYPFRINPFKVMLNFNATGTQAMDVASPQLNSRLDKNSADQPSGFLTGLVDQYAGEVILINDETIPASGWGSDLLAPGGPDGVKFASLPFDIDMDGAFTSTAAKFSSSGNNAARFLVGVVIRWPSKNGAEERFEQWTVISRY